MGEGNDMVKRLHGGNSLGIIGIRQFQGPEGFHEVGILGKQLPCRGEGPLQNPVTFILAGLGCEVFVETIAPIDDGGVPDVRAGVASAQMTSTMSFAHSLLFLMMLGFT